MHTVPSLPAPGWIIKIQHYSNHLSLHTYSFSILSLFLGFCLYTLFSTLLFCHLEQKWEWKNRWKEWLQLHCSGCVRAGVFPQVIFYSLLVRVIYRQKGKQASIMQQTESQYIREWIWVRCPRPIKIMECVTLSPAPQMKTPVGGNI